MGIKVDIMHHHNRDITIKVSFSMSIHNFSVRRLFSPDPVDCCLSSRSPEC